MIRNAILLRPHFGGQSPPHPHACTEAEADFIEAAFPVVGNVSVSALVIAGIDRAAARNIERAWLALNEERKRPIEPHKSPATEHVSITRAHAYMTPNTLVSADLTRVSDGDTVDLPGRKVTFRVERKLRPVTAPIFLPRDLADRVRRMATGLVMDGSFEDDGGVRVTLKIEAREGWTA